VAYLFPSLLLDPKDVDPNVHPTKREVHFLNEEAIIETISDHIQGALAKKSSSKSYETQVSHLHLTEEWLKTFQTLLTGGTLDSSSKRPSKKRKLEDPDEEAATDGVSSQCRLCV
jgi:DNA mismatch repair protein MLH1